MVVLMVINLQKQYNNYIFFLGFNSLLVYDRETKIIISMFQNYLDISLSAVE